MAKATGAGHVRDSARRRASKKATARARPIAHRQTREAHLEQQVREIERDIAGAQEAASYVAVVQLRKLLSQHHAELVAVRAQARDAAELDSDSLVEDLRQVIADMPLDALAELESAIKIRRGLRVVQ